MSRDPEAEQCAHTAVLHVLRSGSPGVPVEAQVKFAAKREVWYWWRQLSRKPKLVQEPEEERVECAEAPEHDSELCTSTWDWIILHEHYIEKVPLDSMARNRGISRRMLEKLILRAEDRFIIAMLLREE